MKAETIAKALGGRKAGGGWVAHCPAHDDRVLALRQPPREHKAPASGPQRAAPYRGGAAAFNNSIPFGCEP
jgi:hypothetical protein